MRKRVFISYRYGDDDNYKEQLLAWSQNSDIEFVFSEISSDASIRQKIREKIESAPYFLCIIGANTYKSCWVEWEIHTAMLLKRKIVAVKAADSFREPDILRDNIGTKWARYFTFDSIKKAIKEV